MDFLTQLRWSPYVVGVGIGIVSLSELFAVEKTLGYFHILCKDQRYA